ncbi:N-acetylmuramic acid 6-phosphate etherase [Vibrio sp. VB16]|uniref:N-acetylmuramic acid 6-phosphate etherase n=1 Tax=Vibrio sp. VB16 TaxID=2785746 RepID=UPI001E28B881|nr:N-acetylmuramic acid 6-phosphate etherase [Vibrio sp. VB16]UGA57707.1 N-acetylmuramic acid 6-phosphate etherase [Vibrio sp. VB16]
MDLGQLVTESRNDLSKNIDTLATKEMLKVINTEDKKVAEAIELILSEIAESVDFIANAFQNNGRLIYIGAGTSGRLGILDASECPPTYGTDPEQVIGLIAGGHRAILQAVENAEDDKQAGRNDLKKIHLSNKDVVVGIAASGRTPYVISAMEYARDLGAKVISLTCNPKSEMNAIADVCLTPVVGPEVITGSSRMKAGTAQKLVLNMLTTGSMIRTGKVYGHLMVDVAATNAKLVERQKNIVMEATGCDRQTAEHVLVQSGGDCKTAVVMVLTETDFSRADELLRKNNGFIRAAINR